jgi:hypothetical protein
LYRFPPDPKPIEAGDVIFEKSSFTTTWQVLLRGVKYGHRHERMFDGRTRKVLTAKVALVLHCITVDTTGIREFVCMFCRAQATEIPDAGKAVIAFEAFAAEAKLDTRGTSLGIQYLIRALNPGGCDDGKPLQAVKLDRNWKEIAKGANLEPEGEALGGGGKLGNAYKRSRKIAPTSHDVEMFLFCRKGGVHVTLINHHKARIPRDYGIVVEVRGPLEQPVSQSQTPSQTKADVPHLESQKPFEADKAVKPKGMDHCQTGSLRSSESEPEGSGGTGNVSSSPSTTGAGFPFCLQHVASAIVKRLWTPNDGNPTIFRDECPEKVTAWEAAADLGLLGAVRKSAKAGVADTTMPSPSPLLSQGAGSEDSAAP